jgi:predicted dehydrogenase
MNDVSIGVIGCGSIGASHIDNFRRIPEVREVHVCDTSKSRVRSLTRRFGLTGGYTEYAALLPHVDAVCVSTPNSLHYEVAAAAIAAGKHLLVEKPLTTASVQAEALVTQAREHGLVLAVGCQMRFNRQYQAIKTVVDEGRIGRPVLVKARMFTLGPYRGWAARSDWYYSKQHGSGALIDTGSHMIDLVLWILSADVLRFSGVLGRNLNLPVEEYAFSLLHLERDVTAVLELGWFTNYNDYQLEVVGTMGRVVVDSQVHRPFVKRAYDYVKGHLSPAKGESFYQDRAFVHSVIGGQRQPPLASGDDGRKVVDLIERMYAQLPSR